MVPLLLYIVYPPSVKNIPDSLRLRQVRVASLDGGPGLRAAGGFVRGGFS